MKEEATLTLVGADGTSERLAYADLQGMAPEHQIPDVSALIPQRRGGALTLESLIALLSPDGEETHVGVHSDGDDFHASVPLEAILGRGLLIYTRDGLPLARADGGPFRFMIRDHAACHAAEVDACANVKYVDRIELTIGAGKDNRPTTDGAHEALHASQEG